VEATAILAAMSIIGAAAAPAIQDYVSDARRARALQDTHVIATALVRLVSDVAAQGSKAGGWATYDLLVSAGEVPEVGPGGDPGWVSAGGGGKVGALADQLVVNGAAYPTHRVSMVNWLKGWHGPYLEAGIGSDPWGHRYAVNVQWLAAGGEFDTVVLTAGPNGIIETPYRADGTVPGGDDIIALVSSGG
jgi:hypothetical protein